MSQTNYPGEALSLQAGNGNAKELDALIEFIADSRNLMILTGAGISTASGIPDYRDQEGVRRGQAPIQGPEFLRHTAVRQRYWARSMIGWPMLADTLPNAGHRALADLQTSGKVHSFVTQNVDGLHQRAGANNVVELHGSIHAVICLSCASVFSRAFLQAQLEALNPTFVAAMAAPAPDGDAQVDPKLIDTFQVPHCPNCQGVLKPDVVFFGDNIPRARSESVFAALQRADALLVVGSSLMVYSGFRLCRMAAEAGKPIAAVNLGKTRADHLIALKIEKHTEEILPTLAQYFG